LYKLKALDEYLLPINIKNNAVFNDLQWFPHWDEKDIEASNYKLKPGTNKMRRMVHIEVCYCIINFICEVNSFINIT